MKLSIIKVIRVIAGLVVIAAGVNYLLDQQWARGAIGVVVGVFWLITSFTDSWWKIGQPREQDEP